MQSWKGFLNHVHLVSKSFFLPLSLSLVVDCEFFSDLDLHLQAQQDKIETRIFLVSC